MTNNKTVLIIDDEPFFMLALRERLQDINITSLQITNIKRAENFLIENLDRLDLIIIDLMIPFGRGHDYSKEKYNPPGLRILEFLESKNHPKRKYLVYSAKQDLDITKYCNDNKINYISKADKNDSKLLDTIFNQL